MVDVNDISILATTVRVTKSTFTLVRHVVRQAKCPYTHAVRHSIGSLHKTIVIGRNWEVLYGMHDS